MELIPVIDFLISIPGPSFLFFFTLFIIFSLFVAWVWGPDDSNRFKLPKLTRFDCFSVAALNGPASVIRTAIFNLWSRNLIKLHREGKNSTLSANGSGKETYHPIEAEVLHFLSSPKDSTDLFSDPHLKEKIEENLKHINTSLQNAHLMRSDLEKAKIWKFCFLVIAIFLTIGGMKLYFGIIFDKPFFFLIFLLILSIIFTFLVLRPTRLATSLGKKYLRELEKHFLWVKGQIQSGKAPHGIEMGLVAAIFGPEIFAQSAHFSPFYHSFRKSDHSSGGCGGCGGGSSSGSGGCGGCGGGGCGGCGG